MAPRTASPYTGRVVVRLTPSVVNEIRRWVRDHGEDLTSLSAVASELHLGELATLLDHYANVPTQWAVTNAPMLRLLDLEEAAADSPYPPQHSLVGYYILDPREGLDASQIDRLLDDFLRNPAIEWAYRETTVRDATVTPEDETAYPKKYRGHFDGASLGINARSPRVWGVCDGSGIGLVDLESGWNLEHEDLPRPQPPLYNRNRAPGNHGTSVLGVIVGQDNARGIVGIAPGATVLKVVSHIKPTGPKFPAMDEWDVAGAIVDALTPGLMQQGDVLLIEVETLGADGIVGYPIETVPLWYDAIRLAVGSRRIVVVEAAGNGDDSGAGRDLDAWEEPVTRRKLSRALGFDSGAILVSACASAITPPGAHLRLGFANFGSRIDCYAWGENVYSAGGGDLTPTVADRNQWYTKQFNGTSSASAIIAGAAILLQGLALLEFGARLNPIEVRKLLSNATTGTPVLTPAADRRIGVMPDLEKILGRLPSIRPGVAVH